MKEDKRSIFWRYYFAKRSRFFQRLEFIFCNCSQCQPCHRHCERSEATQAFQGCLGKMMDVEYITIQPGKTGLLRFARNDSDKGLHDDVNNYHFLIVEQGLR